jgi:predicted phage tail protein
MLMGSVGFTIVLAVTGATMATIKVGAVIAAMVINMAFAIGMSLLMSKLLAPDSPDVASTSSYVFGQAENVTRQGTPVPVGYGRFRVGSTIISASMTNVDKSIVTQNSFYDDVFKDTIETSAVEKNSVEIVSSAIAKNT